MDSGNSADARTRSPAPLSFEYVWRECQREALTGTGDGEHGMRRRRIPGRMRARAHRAASRAAHAYAQAMPREPPRPLPDGQDLLEAMREERDNASLLAAMHGERIGTLVRLIRYLEENGVMDGTPETFGARHATQKYAYLAGEMGAPVEYRFDFLENGAYSAALATDLYMLERAEGGVPPFGAGDAAGEAFVRLVLGRGRLTLQAMTFAMRDMRAGMGRDEFVRTMARDYSRYSRRLLGWAFDSVLAAAGSPDSGG